VVIFEIARGRSLSPIPAAILSLPRTPYGWPRFVGVPVQAPPGASAMSHMMNVTFFDTRSPEPVPTGPGPFAAPHQLHVALSVPVVVLLPP
jgi:hypothetical protein